MSENATKIILYGHPTCPGVFPIKGMLHQAEVQYEYINIHEDPFAREHVRDINKGYESVPTLLFPDGSTLTEPDERELRRKLQAMGYKVPLTAIIMGNLWKLVMAAGIILALLRAFGVF